MFTEKQHRCSISSLTHLAQTDRQTEDECTKEVAAAASGRMCVPAVLHRHFAYLARVRVRRDG